MVAIPILLPLVKPFRASWSGKPFFRAVPHCGQQGEKGKCEVRGLYGIPNLAQIVEGCRLLSLQPSKAPFAAVPTLRFFVSENSSGVEMPD